MELPAVLVSVLRPNMSTSDYDDRVADLKKHLESKEDEFTFDSIISKEAEELFSWTTESPLEKIEKQIKADALKLIQAVDDVIRKLDEHYKNCNIAKTTSNAVATLGGVATVVAGIASFFIAGPLGPIAVGGAVAATLGGLTSAGTWVVGQVLKNVNIADIEKKFNEFKVKVAVSCILVGVQVESGKLPDYKRLSPLDVKDAFAGARVAARLGNAGVNVARGGSEVLNIVKVVGAVSKTLVVANALLLPLSIFDLVTASVELAQDKHCPDSKPLQYLKDHLQGIADGTTKLY